MLPELNKSKKQQALRFILVFIVNVFALLAISLDLREVLEIYLGLQFPPRVSLLLVLLIELILVIAFVYRLRRNKKEIYYVSITVLLLSEAVLLALWFLGYGAQILSGRHLSIMEVLALLEISVIVAERDLKSQKQMAEGTSNL